jgi:hypothetical protein
MLMVMVQDEPQRLRSESEKVRQKILAQTAALKTRVESAERLNLLWREYCDERKRTEECLALARTEYKEVLRKTESAALSGQPRLYWFAKSMFSKLRRHSLEYQVSEAKQKLAALHVAREKLVSLVRRMNLDDGTALVHLFDFDSAERFSSEHAQFMSEVFERIQNLQSEQSTLQKKILELDITINNATALVAEAASAAGTRSHGKAPAIIDSEKMLTSRLPHVGFVNRPKLLALIDQCEYAAEHAERDLQKVRDGLKCASEAAPGGRLSRTSRDWLEYCRTIVCRYKEQLGEASTPP